MRLSMFYFHLSSIVKFSYATVPCWNPSSFSHVVVVNFVRPQIVVNKGILDKSILPLLTVEPTMLPAWDPMGSLASFGEEPGPGLRAHELAEDVPARWRM